MSLPPTYFNQPPTEPIAIHRESNASLTFWPPTPDHEGIAYLGVHTDRDATLFGRDEVEATAKWLRYGVNPSPRSYLAYMGVRMSYFSEEFQSAEFTELTIPHTDQVNARLGRLGLDGVRFTTTGDANYTAQDFAKELANNGQILTSNAPDISQLHDTLKHNLLAWSFVPPRGVEIASLAATRALATSPQAIEDFGTTIEEYMAAGQHFGENIRQALALGSKGSWQRAAGSLNRAFKPKNLGIREQISWEEVRQHTHKLVAGATANKNSVPETFASGQ